ncbi:MAG: XrtA-associated tyrosine autokinase [Pseudomonadota bacterium]
MSIIEKAVGKFDQPDRAAQNTAPAAEIAGSPTSNVTLIERAVDTLDAGQAEAVAESIQAPPAEQTAAREEQTVRHESIDLAKLRLAGMITPNAEKTQIAEEFRLIKRPLLMNAFGQGAVPIKNGNLVMVTSSFPGEGKSFCAINLAMSIAMEMDRTVLLVDADVAKPSIPEFLGFRAKKGLMDVLLDDQLQLSDVLIKTNVEKLTILPAGRGHRHATELLASTAMNRLLAEMAQRYPDRIIIFDSPPLLITTEARVLATHMGQIVMVVEAERTPQEALKEALGQIESCDVVGLLLNKGNGMPGTDYYGSYGSYGK